MFRLGGLKFKYQLYLNKASSSVSMFFFDVNSFSSTFISGLVKVLRVYYRDYTTPLVKYTSFVKALIRETIDHFILQ